MRGSSRPLAHKCSINSGTPPARNNSHRRMVDGAVRQARPPVAAAAGSPRLQAVGHRRPCAGLRQTPWRSDVQQQIRGTTARRVNHHRIVQGFLSVRMSAMVCAGIVLPAPWPPERTGAHVQPDRLTRASQRSVRQRHPQRSATTCDVPAVPRNWQPPPHGDPPARQPASAASSGVISPCGEPGPDRSELCRRLPAGRGAAMSRPRARSPPADLRWAASAGIMAGSPLSHVATPGHAPSLSWQGTGRRFSDCRIIAIRQAVHHSHGSLSSSVAGIADERREWQAASRRSSSSGAASFISRPAP